MTKVISVDSDSEGVVVRSQVCKALSRMPIADQRRVLAFAEDLIEVKRGKRAKRQRVLSERKPYQEDWRI